MNLNILIVDDRRENRVALRKMLLPTGTHVIEAASGDEALALSLTHHFALAILDVQMPVMDGYELAEFLRQGNKTSTLPIIFVSAVYSDDLHVFKGYESGAVDFLPKPFNPRQLLAKVDVFLKLHQQKEYYRGKLDQLGASLKSERDRANRAEARSERYRNASSLTSSIANLVYHAGDMSDMLQSCLQIILDHTNSDVGFLGIYDENHDVIRKVAQLGNNDMHLLLDASHVSLESEYVFGEQQSTCDGHLVWLNSLLGTRHCAGFYDRQEKLYLGLGNHVLAQRGKLAFGEDDRLVLRSAIDIISVILRQRELVGSSMITADLFESLSSDCESNMKAILDTRADLLSKAASNHKILARTSQSEANVNDEIACLNHQEAGVLKTLDKAYSLEQSRLCAVEGLEASNRMMAATRAISQLITQHYDITHLLQRICEELVDSGVFAQVYVSQNDECQSTQCVGANNENMSHDICHSCIEMSRSKTLSDGMSHSVFCQALAEDNMVCYYATIYHKGTVYGTLAAVMNDVSYGFKDIKELLEEVAEEVGFAISSKLREQEVEAQELEFKLVLEATSVGTWRYDVELDQGVLSPQISSHLGCKGILTNFTKESWKQHVHPADLPVILTDIKSHLKQGRESYEIEYRVKHESGDWFWVADRGSVIEWSDNGKPRIFCGTQCNINDKKLAELEKEQLAAELAQSQKLESIGRLAGGVAHDFNNLLSVISGFSELLLMDNEQTPSGIEKLSTIKQACEKAKGLTTQLLMFSRKQTIQPVVVEWNQLIEGSLNVYRRLIEENIELEFEITKSMPNMLADPQQLDQILANLLVNARDAVLQKKSKSRKPRIHITTHREDTTKLKDKNKDASHQFVCLSVSDNGVGMSDDVKSHIFEPFYSTKGLSKGTGLGLATVFAIVEQNGGFIEVDSEVDVGTCFRIYWPITQQGTGTLVEAPTSQNLTGAGQHILVVEDQQQIREYCKNVLERHNYQVSLASSAEEALELMETSEPPDMLVTDVVLLEKSGHQLANEANQRWPDLPVLYCSGYTDDILAHHGVLHPTVNLLNKPFESEELLRSIKRLLAEQTDAVVG